MLLHVLYAIIQPPGAWLEGDRVPVPFSSRDKAYVPGAKPKGDMAALDKELQELVAELQPTAEERQRQQV